MRPLEFPPASSPNPTSTSIAENETLPDPDHPMQDQPASPPPTNTTATTTTTTTTTTIPLNSPLRTHPKRLLPPILSSTYPHGHISGQARSPTQQAAFDARRAEILQTMSAEEIEKAYEEVAAKVRKAMEEGERGQRETEEKKERLRMEREMERRVWAKLRGVKGGD